MFIQFLGQYMLEKGYLSPHQIEEALEYERSAHVRLGTLAMDAGYMTASQVENIHNLQMQVDRRFGELAVEQGYLTEAHLEELLNNQGHRHHAFLQAILDKNFLPLTQIEDILEEYRKQQGFSHDQMAALADFDYDEIVRLLLDFSSSPDVEEAYYNYVSLSLRNFLRFIHENPVITHNRPLQLPEDGWLISQEMTGEMVLYSGLFMNSDVLLEIARRFSEEPLEKVDALAKDSVVEFLNVNNGLYNVNFSDEHSSLELHPGRVEHLPILEVPGAHCISITLSFGTVHLILAPCNLSGTCPA